jgi:hypothetical protein
MKAILFLALVFCVATAETTQVKTEADCAEDVKQILTIGDACVENFFSFLNGDWSVIYVLISDAKSVWGYILKLPMDCFGESHTLMSRMAQLAVSINASCMADLTQLMALGTTIFENVKSLMSGDITVFEALREDAMKVLKVFSSMKTDCL